jgi:hypothetical protein
MDDCHLPFQSEKHSDDISHKYIQIMWWKEWKQNRDDWRRDGANELKIWKNQAWRGKEMKRKTEKEHQDENMKNGQEGMHNEENSSKLKGKMKKEFWEPNAEAE